MSEIALVTIISIIFSAIVFAGNVIYFYRSNQPFQWKTAILYTLAAGAGTWLIYFLTEYVGEL